MASALDRLLFGEARIESRATVVQRREEYVRGEQDLPFAPQGASREYMVLREMSIANWTELYVSAPVQRLRVTGVRAGIGETDDDKNSTNARIWTWFQANKWGKRQSRVFEDIMKHGLGMVSVYPGDRFPKIRPESMENVYLHPSDEDPFVTDWGVKILRETSFTAVGTENVDRLIGYVYDPDFVFKFSKVGGHGWEPVGRTPNRLGRVPFATFDYKARADGEPWSGLDHMMLQQDALNTIRFNMLLAMQFSAFRQRVVTGFDPRVLDENGQVAYQTDEDGTLRLDANGQPIPILADIGKIGVDRLLAFPGHDTKVFDMPESNLSNYINVYDGFLATFFATGQIPTQYLPQKMSNLTGDALAGAESAFASLIRELQLASDEGVTEVAELAWIADGNDPDEWNPAAEASWADAEARSFSQVVDAITKLVAVDFPHRAGFEMIPGATDQKVNTWMEQMNDESFTRALSQIERPFMDVTPQEA